jgi:acyl-coenzyme A thioesterase PaaI-like protein
MTEINTMQDEQTALQPGTHMCFGCGVTNPAGLQIRFFNDGPNACRAEVILDDRYQSFPGIAHGGIIATILDETMGRTTLSGSVDRLMMTAKLEVRYRQQTPLHTKLFVTARVEKDRGRLVTAVGEIRLEDGSITAEANCILAAIPPAELALMDRELAGWQVFP